MSSTTASSLSDETVSPPIPRVDRGNGNFEYISEIDERNMMINAFRAITRSETWDFVAKGPGSAGFMCSRQPEIYKIMNMMDLCEPGVGHSGASFGWTMRHMEFLANYGESAHRKNIQK